jgi:hypothetical protein
MEGFLLLVVAICWIAESLTTLRRIDRLEDKVRDLRVEIDRQHM